ncbi:uncharacterized protein LOC113319310 [Papaver somniferum]|uniref:uncharacterized protein LOC113319310 n=1 Tax=Papaver somniferum TaxID=3469 RepID=UPI000E6FDE79|nr:uncharacterized protein LOC113319310 [Papaver somniferum]XP_026423357.1 uncharacterized protein LOC113319310 [Papaver somniferum]
MDYFKSLPVESTLDILTRLPTESVRECKLVCSNWRNLVPNHPSFSKMHFHYVNHPSAAAHNDSGIFVLNINIEVYIYTLGSVNGWRNLGKFSVGCGREWDQCVFANEALYWLDTSLGMIINFDLAEEKFREHLSPPPSPQDCYWCDTKIGVLNGVLSFAISLDVEGDKFNDIWLLKGEEEHQSLVWSKEIKVGYYYLNFYDVKTSISKKLVKFERWIYRVSPHQNTLVSLKELGEEDTNVMESVEIEETRRLEYTF